MIKIATNEDVTYVAQRMRPHDKAERLALSHGEDVIAAATRFLDMPHLAVTVWKGTPIAVIGVVFPHPGVASTIFFATDQFRHVALATTRFIRRKLFPILLSTGIHRLQVCSMRASSRASSHEWITRCFGAEREAVLVEYGRNREDFTIYVADKSAMARVTSVAN